MKPIQFPEQTAIYLKPENMANEECESLAVYKGQGKIISCWLGNLKDRLRFLFTGKIYLWVAGEIQPPVYLGLEYPWTKKTIQIAHWKVIKNFLQKPYI